MKKIKTFTEFINEANEESFEEFASNRLKGATDITNSAKEKGGDALLTYHHFKVKLPYYKTEVEGTLDLDKARQEYISFLEQLYTKTNTEMNIEQIDFQELVGKLEVLGELLIESKSKK